MSYQLTTARRDVAITLCVCALTLAVFPAFAQDGLPFVERGASFVRAIFSYTTVALILAVAAIVCLLGWAFDWIPIGRIIKIGVAALAIGAIDGIIATLLRAA